MAMRKHPVIEPVYNKDIDQIKYHGLLKESSLTCCDFQDKMVFAKWGSDDLLIP